MVSERPRKPSEEPRPLSTAPIKARPLSPHLTIWKWGPAMAVSIFHRVSGDGLAVVGGLSLIWWLAAAASGAQAFEYFQSWATSWIGIVIGVGLTWAFFQHMFGGIRHLVLDTGAGYELKTNKIWSIMVFVGALLMTALVWFIIVKGAI